MTARVNHRRGEVRRALAAMRAGGDTRLLKRELQAGNPYAHRLIGRRGLVYADGLGIIRREDRDRLAAR